MSDVVGAFPARKRIPSPISSQMDVAETIAQLEVVDPSPQCEEKETEDFDVFEWKRAGEQPLEAATVSTKMFHRQKDESTVRGRIAARQFNNEWNPELKVI